MGATSNKTKQQWNEAHYTQVKISIKKEIAAQFKAKCIAKNVSMASEISKFMSGQIQKPAELKVTTRRERRKSLVKAIVMLEKIVQAEQEYKYNIPINLQNSERYESADEATTMLEEALNALHNVYIN